MTLRQKTVLIVGSTLAALLILTYGLLTQQSSIQTDAARQQTALIVTLIVLVAGLALSAVVWWLLDRHVLNRLAQLGRVFDHIQASGDLSQRVDATGQDEIAALSRSANALLDQLQSSAAAFQQREAERARHRAAMAEMSRAAIANQGLESLLAQAVDVIRERFGCERVRVILLDEAGAAVVRETAGPRQPSRGSRVAAGVSADARTAAAFPLRAGKRDIGALEVQSERPNALSPADAETLQLLADQIAVAVENDRLLGRQKRLLQLEDLTLTLTNKIHQSLKPETILESAALELGRALGAQRAVVKLFGDNAPQSGEREVLRTSSAQSSIAPAPQSGEREVLRTSSAQSSIAPAPRDEADDGR
jgi:GAF domain-containing protein/HAMP domain-containing protein